jgi:nitrite reductase/ring-hydroxylating ferredoxin subunit
MGPRPDLYPFPTGWYVFGTSEEVQPGRLIGRPFMGQEVVVFRAKNGQAYAVEAYCPHLGANFSYGGKVEGELLQCPFHGFQFNGGGECTRTGYRTEVPPKAKLRTYPLCEQNGFVLIYHDMHAREPAWQVPAVETQGWTRLICRAFVLRDHPQETTENSVDLGHFGFVHGYQNARTLKEFQADGPYLSTQYAVSRPLELLGMRVSQYDFEFETEIYGLGYSLVHVRVPRFQVSARLWVLPTAIDEERLTLRLALRMKKWEGAAGQMLSPVVARMIMNGFVHDAQQDFPIWENKRFNPLPALARGDGPIGKYRQWAKQFYDGKALEAKQPSQDV